jgi:hypothetical protein
MHNNSNFYKNATKLFKKNDQQSDAISGGTNLYPTSYYYRNHLKPIKIKIHRTNGPKWLPPSYSSLFSPALFIFPHPAKSEVFCFSVQETSYYPHSFF